MNSGMEKHVNTLCSVWKYKTVIYHGTEYIRMYTVDPRYFAVHISRTHYFGFFLDELKKHLEKLLQILKTHKTSKKLKILMGVPFRGPFPGAITQFQGDNVRTMDLFLSLSLSHDNSHFRRHPAVSNRYTHTNVRTY